MSNDKKYLYLDKFKTYQEIEEKWKSNNSTKMKWLGNRLNVVSIIVVTVLLVEIGLIIALTHLR